MTRSNLCDYSDAYILVSDTITIDGLGDDDAAKRQDERNKGVILTNWAPLTECISIINNTQIDNTKDINVVKPMYNLIEYSGNYSKTSGSSRQYYRDEPSDQRVNSDSFKSKIKITGKTPDHDNKKKLK